MKRVMSTFLALTLLLSALPAARALTVYGYSEGLAQCEEAGLWGFATPDGAAVIPPQYNSVVSFALGMAAVNLGGKLGVIRPDGQYLIPPEYDTLMPIGYGLYMAQRGSDWGVVSILPYTGADGKETPAPTPGWMWSPGAGSPPWFSTPRGAARPWCPSSAFPPSWPTWEWRAAGSP